LTLDSFIRKVEGHLHDLQALGPSNHKTTTGGRIVAVMECRKTGVMGEMTLAASFLKDGRLNWERVSENCEWSHPSLRGKGQRKGREQNAGRRLSFTFCVPDLLFHRGNVLDSLLMLTVLYVQSPGVTTSLSDAAASSSNRLLVPPRPPLVLGTCSVPLDVPIEELDGLNNRPASEKKDTKKKKPNQEDGSKQKRQQNSNASATEEGANASSVKGAQWYPVTPNRAAGTRREKNKQAEKNSDLSLFIKLSRTRALALSQRPGLSFLVRLNQVSLSLVAAAPAPQPREVAYLALQGIKASLGDSQQQRTLGFISSLLTAMLFFHHLSCRTFCRGFAP